MEDYLDNFKKTNSPQVPDGYFESLPDQVMARIIVEDSLTKAKENASPSIPDGYFDALPDQVMSRIMTAEALEKSKANAHPAIPEGYFDTLPDQVMARVKNKQRSLFIRRRITTAMSIAASGLILFGIGLFIADKASHNPDAPIRLVRHGQEIHNTCSQPEVEPEETRYLLAAAEIPVQQPVVNHQAPAEQSPIETVDLEEVPIGEFSSDDLNSIDYELLEYYSDDSTAELFEL